MTLRLAIFGFIAFPGHAWLWACAKLVGMEFTYWSVSSEEQDEGLKR